MKERVIYNTYYPDFEDFRSAVFGFFAALSVVDQGSILGQAFRSRIRDHFRLISTPVRELQNSQKEGVFRGLMQARSNPAPKNPFLVLAL